MVNSGWWGEKQGAVTQAGDPGIQAGHPNTPLHPHLIPPQFEGDGDIYGVIDDAHHRAHQ